MAQAPANPLDPASKTDSSSAADPARDLLTPLSGVDQSIKAMAHDVYWGTDDADTFKTKVGALNIPQEIKAKLWDAKFGTSGTGTGAESTAVPGKVSGTRTPVTAEDLLGENHPVVSGVTNALMGVGHGAITTAQTLASPIRKAFGMDPATPPDQETTIAGSVGKGLERVGEFFVPEVYIAKYGKAIALVSKLRASGMGVAAAKILGTLPEAVAQAIGAYGVAKVQKDENPKAAAAIAGAVPVVGAAASAMAPRIMRSALGEVSAKLLKRYKTSTQEIAQTMLDHGVNVTKRGLDRLQTALDVTDDQLDKVIGGLKGLIDPKQVATRTADTAKTFGEQVNPNADLETIAKKTDEFLHHAVHSQQVITGVTSTPSGVLDARGQPVMTHTPVYTHQTAPLTAAEAQSLKRGTYKQLKGKYAKFGSASVETEKALARGLREEIETLAHSQGVHSVEAINQQERQLMAALEGTGERLAKLERPLPAGSIQYAIRWAVHHPYSALSAVAKLEGAPIRSIVARTLASESPIVTGSSLMVRAAVQALVSGGEAEPGDASPAGAATGPRLAVSHGSSTGPAPGSRSAPPAGP